MRFGMGLGLGLGSRGSVGLQYNASITTDAPRTEFGDYYLYTFSSGSTSFTVAGTVLADILLVAGGGGGSTGNNTGLAGAGGGAGGIVLGQNQLLTTATYLVAIGAGGVARTGNILAGAAGSDSMITIGESVVYVAKGGGGGSRYNTSDGISNAGGCGGGAAGITAVGIRYGGNVLPATPPALGYGGKGGDNTTRMPHGTGGGGAGSAATDNESTGGTGKDTSAIFGTGIGVAGVLSAGGAGGRYNPSSDGAAGLSATINAAANTGCGGGGSGGNTNTSGAGGSGICVIKIAKSMVA